MRVHVLRTFVTHLLVHMHQKEKIASKIESVHGTLDVYFVSINMKKTKLGKKTKLSKEALLSNQNVFYLCCFILSVMLSCSSRIYIKSGAHDVIYNRPIKINEIFACVLSFLSDFGQIVLILFDFFRPICSVCGVFRFLSVISTNKDSSCDHMV